MIRSALIVCIFSISLISYGQQISPLAAFQKDTVAIGEEVPYSLWIRYPRDRDVIFPDSLYDFTPFEINSRKYFTTKSDSTLSLDSVVFFLSTFEIDTVQHLQLPIYLIDEFDSVELLPAIDSIVLRHVVEAIPDSVAVMVNTEYQKVPLAFNYPYFTAAIIILLLAALIIFLAFGGRIKKMIRVYWIGRRHKRFLRIFHELIDSPEIEVEKCITTWKKYLERLENKPYSKLTTKEIFNLTENSELRNELDIIDRFIYAGSDKPETDKSFNYLASFAVEQYQNKIEEIKHG